MRFDTTMKIPFYSIFGLLLTLTSGLADDKPNVLLIVSEDNGPELGCYGDPFLDVAQHEQEG